MKTKILVTLAWIISLLPVLHFFGEIWLAIDIIIFLFVGIYLFRRRGYWVKLIENIVAVCTNENGISKVMTKNFMARKSDKIRYLNSGPIPIVIDIHDLISKDDVHFDINSKVRVQLKKDHKSIVEVATTKPHGETYVNYITSSEKFINNRVLAEEKLRTIVSGEDYNGLTPLAIQQGVAALWNDLFVENFELLNGESMTVVEHNPTNTYIVQSGNPSENIDTILEMQTENLMTQDGITFNLKFQLETKVKVNEERLYVNNNYKRDKVLFDYQIRQFVSNHVLDGLTADLYTFIVTLLPTLSEYFETKKIGVYQLNSEHFRQFATEK